jgi:hypothetical protein
MTVGPMTTESQEQTADARREQVRSLAPLLDEIVAARLAEKEQQCRRGITAAELARIRGETLEALEGYAAALEVLSWPVPRAVLQEIRLHKALLGVPASGRVLRERYSAR